MGFIADIPDALDAEAWQAVAAWLGLILVAVGAFYARRQLSLAAAAREEQIRPFVVVDFDVEEPQVIYLRLENAGKTVARDVRLEFSPEIETTLSTAPLKDTTLVRKGVPYLPPGKVIRAVFDMFIDREEANLPDSYEVTVRLKDYDGHEMRPETVYLDLSVYKNLLRLERKGIHQIAVSLASIDTRLKSWTRGQSGISVITRGARAYNRTAHRTLGYVSPKGRVVQWVRRAWARLRKGLGR